MPVVSSIVAEEGPVEDGLKFLRFEFTLSTGRVEAHYGYRRYSSATVADTQRLAIVPELNAALKQQERDEAWEYGIAGNDIDVFPWEENTTAEIQQYWWRRFMNFMRDESDDPFVSRRNKLLATAMTPLGYANKNNNAVIAGFIDDPNWNAPTVNSALGKAAAMYNAVTQLDHGEAEIPNG